MKFDPEKIDLKSNQDGVNIFVYKVGKASKTATKAEKELPKDAKHLGNSACFNGLLELIKREAVNRVWIAVRNTDLTEEEIKAFINLCKRHKLLPAYTTSRKVIEKKAAVFDCSKCTSNQLYVYLNSIRMLYGYTSFVRNLLYLRSTGINFYAAYAFASRIRYSNMNHHIMPLTSGPKYPAITKTTAIPDINDIELGDMIGLFRFLMYHDKYNNNKFKHYTGFTCNTCIQNASKIRRKIDFKSLFKPVLAKIIMTEEDSKIDKDLLKQL